jgi:hypothetical protein
MNKTVKNKKRDGERNSKEGELCDLRLLVGKPRATGHGKILGRRRISCSGNGTI